MSRRAAFGLGILAGAFVTLMSQIFWLMMLREPLSQPEMTTIYVGRDCPRERVSNKSRDPRLASCRSVSAHEVEMVGEDPSQP